MKKQEIKRMFQEWTKKRANTLKSNTGASEVVAVVALIIVVLVVVAVAFLPGIMTYINTTVMPGLGTATENLFNFAG